MQKDWVFGIVILSVIIIVIYMSKGKIKDATLSVVDKVVTGLSTDTIKSIVSALRKIGITDPLTQAGIISEIYTESKFVPKSETGYSNTSNERIKTIFKTPLANVTDSELTQLKKSDEKFFDKVYGNRMGNAANEGYKYRGRGLNQLTGKANYQKYAQLTGFDIVTYPDLVNRIDVAIAIAANFFNEGLKALKPVIKTTKDATRAALQINAGLGTNIDSEFLSGVNVKQMGVIDSILNTVKNVS